MQIRMRKSTWGGLVFDVFNYIFLSVFALCAIIPFVYVVAASFATERELTQKAFLLFPTEFSLNAYTYIFSSRTLLNSLFVSVCITLFGTATNLFFTITMAYPLARRDLVGRNILLNAIIFSMLFSGGMIPAFLIVRGLGMYNSFLALILPGAISAFNLIVVKNFFQELPPGLEESARIDGCTDIGVLLRIVLPLSMPVMATFGLFYAVGHWNNFFSALIYISSPEKWPLQVILRSIVMLSQSSIGDISQLDPTYVKPPEATVKMAVIVVGTVPILCVYPFLQKHFAKGVMIGAIKG